MTVAEFQADISLVQGIAAVPAILDVVCRATGMGFAAVARVTEDRWVACQVLDNIHFGLGPGGELPVETTLCNVVRAERHVVVFDDARDDPVYAAHITPRTYGLRSYISVPILLSDGSFFGTLCAIDPQPAKVNNPQTIGTFQLFAELIGHHIDAAQRVGDAELTRQRSILAEEAGGIGTFEVDIDTSQMAVSAEYCRLFGLPLARHYPTSVSQQLVLPEDAQTMSSDETRRDGSAPGDVEYRIRRADNGEVRWIARRARFVRDETGRPRTMFGVVSDVTERHRVEDQQRQLLELGDRLRDAETSRSVVALAAEALGASLQVDRAGYARVDRSAGTLTVEADWFSRSLNSIVGVHRLDTVTVTLDRLALGETLAIANIQAAAWLGDDRSRYAEAAMASMIDVPLIDHGVLVGILFVHHSKGRTWRKDEVDFAHAVADRTYTTLARLDAEANQELLNRELGHRMKNQLAMIQAIINQSLRSAPDIQTASQSLNARIQVLARAHDLIVMGESGRTTVERIVHDLAELHDDLSDRRIEAAGPHVAVASRPALSLALILHELSTNAAKYGSLSVPGGKVRINWGTDRNEDEPNFFLVWKEHGGPHVRAPEHQGSGSRLIRAGVAGVPSSSVTVEYEADGVRCTIRAALAGFQVE